MGEAKAEVEPLQAEREYLAAHPALREQQINDLRDALTEQQG